MSRITNGLAPIRDNGPDIINRLNAISKLKYLYFKCHETSGTSIDEMSGVHPSGFFDTVGTTTHQWDTQGYFSGNDGVTAGDRYYRDEAQTEAVQNIMRLDDVSAGSMIIAARLIIGTKANISTAGIIASYGQATGGFMFNIDSSANIQWQLYDLSSNVKAYSLVTAAQISDGVETTVGVAVNLGSKLGQTYQDLITRGANASYAALTGEYHDTSTDIGTKGGLTLFARGHVATPDFIFGEASTGIKVSNIMFAKCTDSGLFDNAASIFADYKNYSGDIPRSLLEV